MEKKVKQEIQLENWTSNRDVRLEVIEVNNSKPVPLLGNRDMVMLMCLICSILLAYLYFDKNSITPAITHGILGYVFIYVVMVSYLTGLLFWITQKIVRFCYINAKRKADTKVD